MKRKNITIQEANKIWINSLFDKVNPINEQPLFGDGENYGIMVCRLLRIG